MFRCQVCNTVSRPRQPRYTHSISKSVKVKLSVSSRCDLIINTDCRQLTNPRREILREIGICEICHHSIQSDSIFKEAVELKMLSGVAMPLVDASAPPYVFGLPKTVAKEHRKTLIEGYKVATGTRLTNNMVVGQPL